MGEITITLESEERKIQYEGLEINFDSTDSEIVEALSPMLEEDVGINLKEEFDNGNWMIKKIDDSENIYIFPKSTAGGNIKIGA